MRHIALSKLYPIYSLQTSAFYLDDEAELDRQLCALRVRANQGKKSGGKKKSRQQRENEKLPPLTKADRKENIRQIKRTKERLKQLLLAHMSITREVRPECLTDRNIVCIFDSDLTRSLGLRENVLNDAIIIVKVYYYEVAESIIKHGFYLNGEKYVFFSASAGQIRTKKFVAVKESVIGQCMDKLTCGLSLERINRQGGINVNKYLAYLALCNSATDLWEDFDIDRCIVVEDFETEVPAMVDHITVADGAITRRQMDVPVTHTDGCGMILPSLSHKNFMVRLPWIKGLLAAFPFDKFIREANRRDSTVNHGLITDIYGTQHDVLAENIQIIFTRSQFKLAGHYASWEEYKANFKRFGCSAGKCNVEENYIPNAQFNYQMLQTLSDMTSDELELLAAKTNEKILRLSSDRNTMLQVFGAAKFDRREEPFQECLHIYPELLQDAYCVESLRSIKNKLVKEGRGGRLDIRGKYLFLIPDLYAACEHWFLGIKTPKGLLADGEVYCRSFPADKKLDCLRSPHLYREHAVRRNTFGENDERKRWFATDGIYTSSWDVISKILQFDNDGDKSLVCAEPVVIEAAERNCKDVAPLYYEMKKAPAHVLDADLMWQGMKNAYDGGKIGPISNSISKIWNSASPDLDAVKLLCAQTNYTIDYAKTLYMPNWPEAVAKRMQKASSGKVPHFFIYAKDKAARQVEPANDSVVNRLEKIVRSPNLRFEKRTLGKFDYRMLMRDPETQITEHDMPVINLFNELSASCGNRLIGAENGKDNQAYVFREIRADVLALDNDVCHVTDILVLQLFAIQNSKRKRVFWGCFGDVVLENLRRNIDQNTILCERCGQRLLPTASRQRMCLDCAEKQRRALTRERVRRYRERQQNVTL